VLGDTLAAQLLGGFKEGVGMADKPCRTFEITHTQLSDSLHGSQFALRDEQEHKERWCTILASLPYLIGCPTCSFFIPSTKLDNRTLYPSFFKLLVLPIARS
jgi:hypothetical protein